MEEVALALGVADYSERRCRLLGPSAARSWEPCPVRSPSPSSVRRVHRSPLQTSVGRLVFSFREIERLDLQRVQSDLVSGYTATTEQTVLDLAATPTLAGISVEQAAEARRALLPRCDLDVVERLARLQHRRPHPLRYPAIRRRPFRGNRWAVVETVSTAGPDHPGACAPGSLGLNR
jgi:hypothetical protein